MAEEKKEPKIIFRNALGGLCELAASQDRVLTRAQVEDYFEQSGAAGLLSEEHFDMVCDYLLNQHIRVEGYTPSRAGNLFDPGPEDGPEAEVSSGLQDLAEGGEASANAQWEEDPYGEEADAQTGDGEAGASAEGQTENSGSDAGDEQAESRLLELYLEELDGIAKIPAEEEHRLFDEVAAGGRAARDRLAEIWLETVCSLAAEYEGEAISAEDLIQEGNMALLLALDRLEPMDSLAAYRAALLNEVNKGMDDAIRIHREERSEGERTVNKVNRLDEAVQSLMEDLGRRVTVDEVSAFLEIPAEEIREIVRLAGEDLGIDDSVQKMPWEQ